MLHPASSRSTFSTLKLDQQLQDCAKFALMSGESKVSLFFYPGSRDPSGAASSNPPNVRPFLGTHRTDEGPSFGLGRQISSSSFLGRHKRGSDLVFPLLLSKLLFYANCDQIRSTAAEEEEEVPYPPFFRTAPLLKGHTRPRLPELGPFALFPDRVYYYHYWRRRRRKRQFTTLCSSLFLSPSAAGG